MSVKRKLIRNTIINYAIRIWSFTINFFLMWFIVTRTSEPDYGIYLFVAAIVGYFGILDLGIGNSLIKFVAQYQVEDDKKKINEAINTTFFIFLFIGIAGAMVLFLIGTILFGYFGEIISISDSPDFNEKARTIIFILGANFIFSLSMASLKGAIAGIQRYDILALITFISSLINVGITVVVLSLGQGIVEFVFYTTCFGLLQFVMVAWFIQKLLPFVEIKYSYMKRSMVKILFELSVSVFLLSMFVMVIYYTDRLVIGIFLAEMALITYYQAAWRVYMIPGQIPAVGLYAIIPAASELEASDNIVALRKLFLRGTKYVLAICLAFAIPIFFLSREILSWWMGTDYAPYYLIVHILMISLFFDFNNYVATQILIGMNRIQKFVKYYAVVAVLNLGLSIFLVRQGFGLEGVALGTTIPFVILEVLFLRHVFKVLDIKWGVYTKQVFLRTFPIALPVAGLMYGLIFLRAPFIVGSGMDASFFVRLKDLVEIGIYYLAGTGFYLILFYYLSLEPYEKGEIKQTISSIRARLKLSGKKKNGSQIDSEDSE
ncbi:MAG: polysaccharide biosynthesis C-terminal domain-containing protein [Thermoplasmata archaeon]|nr:MAG: polysaccharide biosynthesis C-terminal domain-containing protein [Thermoplasmata archaeon]